MKSFLLLIVLYGTLSSSRPIHLETEQATQDDVQLLPKFLESDYPQPEPIPDYPQPEPVLRSTDNNVVAEQESSGLEATDKQDSTTLDVMKNSRCGVPDMGDFSFFDNPTRWPRTRLTYSIWNYPTREPRMHPREVEEAIARALMLWAEVTPFTFERLPKGQGDIRISFIDGRDPLFESQVHAFAYQPGEGKGGDAYFSDSYLWTKDLPGLSLFLVAAHEFGHSLGLGHSHILGAVMYKTYEPYSYIYGDLSDIRTLRLHRDDVDGIQTLYELR